VSSSKPEGSSFSEFAFDPSMFNLFCAELEVQCKALNQGLVELEKSPKNQTILESLMRAAHSIKGAARVVNLKRVVSLAHAMEDCLAASKNQQGEITSEKIDKLLEGVDFLTHISKQKLEGISVWFDEHASNIEELINDLATQISATVNIEPSAKPSIPQELNRPVIKNQAREKDTPHQDISRVLRITAENLNQLMGLAGESLIDSRWLVPYGEKLVSFKKKLESIEKTFSLLRDSLENQAISRMASGYLKELSRRLNTFHATLNDRLSDLDNYIHRSIHLSDRLYQEVINSRMRPFSDIAERFPRLVRDLGRQLGKKVRIEMSGLNTQVDREILEKLESPLSHLIRNAIDHGIESSAVRFERGKPAEGVIKLESHHFGGMLAITISDDGNGIDYELLRRKIFEKKLTGADLAMRLTEAELLDFLFLPGFTTSDKVTEISGRGVGLDVVRTMVEEVGGTLRAQSVTGQGMVINLQLPLTLSIMRALLVEISDEIYAFPLARIDHAFILPYSQIELVENHQYFHHEGENIGLVPAWEIFDSPVPDEEFKYFSVIILNERTNRYGLVVDRFIGEKELVVQELDAKLGKIPNISAAALNEDGSPVLIVDVEDTINSIDNILSGARLKKLSLKQDDSLATVQPKRILVVDDSITVREVESRLLMTQGYHVETAVNGIDAWNAIRIGKYDLVITDIDMPRMNGFELLKLIKKDPKYHELPVMIISYKEGIEDQMRGQEGGADYYFTKSSFDDASLIDAVRRLI